MYEFKVDPVFYNFALMNFFIGIIGVAGGEPTNRAFFRLQHKL